GCRPVPNAMPWVEMFELHTESPSVLYGLARLHEVKYEGYSPGPTKAKTNTLLRRGGPNLRIDGYDQSAMDGPTPSHHGDCWPGCASSRRALKARQVKIGAPRRPRPSPAALRACRSATRLALHCRSESRNGAGAAAGGLSRTY